MTKKRKLSLSDMIHMIMLLSLSYALLLLIQIYGKLTLSPFVLPTFLGILLLSYLFNHIVHHIFVYLGLHLGLILGLFYLPLPIVSKVVCFVFLLFIIVFDIMFWCNTTESTVVVLPWLTTAAFPVIYLYLSVKGNSEYLSSIYLLGVLYLSLSLLSYYLSNTALITEIDKDNGYVPVKDIIQNNNFFVFGIVGILFTSTVLLHSPTLERMVKGVFNGIAYLAKKFFVWFFSLFKDSGEHLVEEPHLDSPSPFVPMIAESEPSALAIAIQYLITTVLFACVIIGLSYAIYRFLRKYLRRNTTRTSEIPSGVIQTKEHITSEKQKKERKFLSFATNNERVRHYYRKKLRKLSKKGVQLSTIQTPNERTVNYCNQEDPHFNDLTKLYNKARYSNQEITTEDCKVAKSYL